MGADLIEHATGEFSRAVFVKGGSGDPSLAPATVDSVTAAPTFVVSSLGGYGDDYFTGWFAYVVWDSAGGGAAPQSESQVITDYVSATGTFSHAAFTAALVAGDKVLLSLTDPTAIGDATAANQAIIIAAVNAILTLTETGGTVTTDGTEQNVYINNAPAGVFEPKMVHIDFTNHTAGETVIVREYYRIKSGGGLIKNDEIQFAGVQDPLLKTVTLEPNRFGAKVTIEKTAGTNRAYDFEAVYGV